MDWYYKYYLWLHKLAIDYVINFLELKFH